MILSRDIQSFQKGLLELYAPGLDLDNYPERSFRLLTRLIPVELTVHGMCASSPISGNVLFQVDRLLPELEQTVRPFGLMAPKYPWFCVHPSTHLGKPHYRSDFYSDREYRSLDIHAEVFRRWGHENFMSMCVYADRDKTFFFGFSRARGDFSRRERKLIEMAQLHLANARRLALRLSAAKPWEINPVFFSRSGFTPRESEVLYWLTEGKSNIEIATILHIGLPTVKGYLTSIFNKTGTGNRLAATVHAVELGKKLRTQENAWSTGPLAFKALLGSPPTKVG